MQDVMPNKKINDLKQRAMTTIDELNADTSVIADTLRPYRIRHVENMIEVLRDYSLAAGTDDDDRADAQQAITDIARQLRRVDAG
jgi:hypothetical protein